ncbi:MAG: enoyl-CoA hydratase/isomerase family protein, partial [Acidobacteria bacterium]|nr:enoyl-CoA hydratase/isomerase family protein [Acidobacteriota bacterium]
RQFLPPHKAAFAVGRIKRAVQVAEETSFIGGLCVERELQQQLFLSHDGREGLTAWVERRTPKFTGT